MKRILSIFIGILLLIAFLLFGIPIEVTTKPLFLISIWLLTFLIGSLFYFLFRQIFKLKNIILKITSLSLTSLLFIIYILFGFDTVILPTFLSDDSIPVDVAKYENKEGDIIVERFSRISGSIHYSDFRKVIHDFENGIRISQNYDDNDLIGDWICHDYESNTMYYLTIKIENGERNRYKKPYVPLE